MINYYNYICKTNIPSMNNITLSLFISDAPKVFLSLGAPLDPSNLIKGSDVYLECDIKANPPAQRVEWFHNVRIHYFIICRRYIAMQHIYSVICILIHESSYMCIDMSFVFRWHTLCDLTSIINYTQNTHPPSRCVLLLYKHIT